MDKAIEAEHLSKIYRLYGNNKDRLKEMFRFYRKEYLYKEYHALEDISFSIFRGETVGIIGTNGSGNYCGSIKCDFWRGKSAWKNFCIVGIRRRF